MEVGIWFNTNKRLGRMSLKGSIVEFVEKDRSRSSPLYRLETRLIDFERH